MARGAPLRFMGAVLAAWTGARVLMLWPADAPPPLVATPAQATTRGSVPERRAAIAAARPPAAQPVQQPAKRPDEDRRPDARVTPSSSAPAPTTVPAASLAPVSLAATAPPPSTPPREVPQPFAPAAARSRLAGDAWLVARPGGGNSLAFGQLGASQGGARLTYALDDARRVALSARLSAPLDGAEAEAGLGVDMRPTRLPLHLIAEERLGLDGGGARPAVTLVAGGAFALPARLRLDAYGQGGAVWHRGGFADGAMLVDRPVVGRGATRLEVGAGAWGAAQRRVARLDLGPSAALTFPAGRIAARLQLDYRLRVAGRARPGSGPALTLGGSF